MGGMLAIALFITGLVEACFFSNVKPLIASDVRGANALRTASPSPPGFIRDPGLR